MLIPDPGPEVKAAAVTGEVTPAKPRKKRASKHDFKDGNGRVFAHRHVNGGGWVADTARVADSVLVAKMAQVYHAAEIIGAVQIKNKAKICGYANLQNQVQILNYGFVGGNARLIDETIVKDGATVMGGFLCGSTRVENEAQVRNSPMLRNTIVRDKSIVAGYASLLNVTCELQAHVAENAQILHSTLRGFVSVGGHAKVIASNLSQRMSYYTTAGLEENNRLKVIDHAIICDCDDIAALIVFKGHAKALGCTFRFGPVRTEINNLYTAERIETDSQALFAGVTINSPGIFASYNVSPSARPPMGNRAQTPIGQPINMAVLAPSRRLMAVREVEV